jgi:hypothetical protein
MLGIVILNWSANIDVLLKQINSVLLYGSVVIFVSIAFSVALPKVFPKVFDPEKWNVLKTITFILLTIITIGFAITLIAYNIDNPKKINFLFYFVNILVRSIVLSFFPIIFLVFYFERILHKKNQLIALKILDEINEGRQANPKHENSIVFTFAKGKNDELMIAENDLIYVKAEGNYCNFIYKNDLVLHRKLVRCSMKDVELSMANSHSFIRCHKSYIVNLSTISNITGNARGYVLSLNDYDYKIPGSRNLSKSIIHRIKKTLQNSSISPW